MSNTFEIHTTGTSVGAAILSPILAFYGDMWIFLVLAFALIVVDARFGIEAARKRGERIRTSRMLRRCFNKFIDYICWASVAGIFSAAYGEILGVPLLTAFVMLFVYAIEIISIVNNYLEFRGYKFRFRMKNVFERMLGRVASTDVTDIVEESGDEGKGK